MTASYFLPLEGQSTPDIDSKPIKRIGGCYPPLFMEDNKLHEITGNQNKDYGKPFTGRKEAVVNH
jgi:hypothetical protein